MSNSIKTILTVEDSDVKSKLSSLKTSYEDTYKGIEALTKNLSSKEKEWATAKNDLLLAQKGLRVEKEKGEKGDKETLVNLKQGIVLQKELIAQLNIQKTVAKAQVSQELFHLDVTNRTIKATEAKSRGINQEISAIDRQTAATAKAAAQVAQSAQVEKESTEAMKKAYAQTYENTKASNAYNAAIERLNTMKAKGVISQDQYNSAVKKETELLQKGAPERDNQFNHMIRMMRWAGTLAGAYYAVTMAWDKTIGKGIELGRQIEDMGMGISALTAANTSNISANGLVLTSMEKFRLATTATVDTMKQLRKAAVDTPASFSEISSIFQQAYVSTSKMGQGFGLTTESITKNTVQLATRMANIAGAIGMPMQKALEETRSLMSGQASGDSLIASLLFGSPAAANAAMRKAEGDGPLAVKKMLDGVMASFDVLAGVDTYTKSLANMRGAYENLITKMADPVKNDMANLFKNITKSFDENTVSGRANIKELTEGFDAVYGSISHILKGVLLLAKPITATLTLSGSGWVLLAKLFDGKVNQIVADKERTKYTPVTSDKQDTYISTEVISQKKKELATINAEIAKAQNKPSFWDTAFSLDRKGGRGDPKTDAREMLALKEKQAKIQRDINGLQIIHNAYQTKGNETLRDKLSMNYVDNKAIELGNALVSASPEGKQLEITQKRQTLLKSIHSIEAATNQLKKGGVTPAELEIITRNGELVVQQKKALAELDRADAVKADKNAAKAETAANKASTEARKTFDLRTEEMDMETRRLEMLEAKKTDGFRLESANLTALQNNKIFRFNSDLKNQEEIINLAKKTKDPEDRRHQLAVETTKMYSLQIGLMDTRQRILKGETDELEKQEKALGRIAAKEMDRFSSELLHTLAMRQESPAFERSFGKDKLPSDVGQEAIAWERSKGVFESLDLSDEEAQKVQDKVEKAVQQIESRIAQIPNIELTVNLKGWDDFSNSLADMGNAFATMTKTSQDFGAMQGEIDKQLAIQNAKTVKDTKEITRLETAKTNNKVNQSHKELQSYSAITGAVASMFKSESKEAKALHEVQKTIAIVEMTMTVQAMVMDEAMTAKELVSSAARATAKATEAVAGAFVGIGPTGLVTGALMIAALVALGLFSGGGGGSGAPTAEYGTTGTVLGAGASGQSESTSKVVALMESIHVSEYSELRSINRAVTSMAGSITSAVTNIFRSGVLDTSGVSLNNKIGSGELWKKMGESFMGELSLGSINAKLTDFVFGGSSKQSIRANGFEIGGGTLASKQDGSTLGASTYVDVETNKRGLFGSHSYSYNKTNTALDSASSNSIALIYKSFSDTMLEINKGLGTDLAPAVNGYVLDAIDLNLKGLTGEESVKKLNDVFSALGDTMTSDVFGSLIDQYQKLGEGLLETATRIIVEKEVVLQDLGDIGLSVSGDIIAVSQSLVTLSGGLDNFQDSLALYYDKYFTDAEKLANTQKHIGELFTKFNAELTDLGAPMLDLDIPSTTKEFRELVDSLNLATEEGQKAYAMLMSVSGAFYDITAAVEASVEALNKQLTLLRATDAEAVQIERQTTLNALTTEAERLIQNQIFAQEDLNASNANYATLLASLRTPTEQATFMAGELGVTLATSVEELGAIYNQLAHDVDGLSSADLALINANKALLISTTVYQTQIKDLNTTLTATTKSVTTLEAVFKSITDTVNRLRDASRTPEQKLQVFSDAMIKAQGLSGSEDYAAYSTAIQEAVNASSALLNKDNFALTRDMEYAQLVAANQFEAMGETNLTQIDYLKVIAGNTGLQILTMTEAMNNLGANINASLAALVSGFKAPTVNYTSPSATPIASTSLITAAYRDILQRAPETAGLDYWQGQLKAGELNTSNITQAISSASLQELYKTVLGRDPDTAGLNYWLNEVNTGRIAPDQIDDVFKIAAQKELYGLAVGTPNVPQDMMANIHRGEIIIPQTFSDGIRSGAMTIGSQAQLVEELRVNNSLLSGIIAKQDQQIQILLESRDIQNGSLVVLETVEGRS